MSWEVFGPAWKFTAAERSDSWKLQDTRRGEVIALWGWSKLNNMPESDALTGKCRFHGKIDNCEAQIEVEKVYPFGGESIIDRNFIVRDKVIEVRVDVKPGRSEVVRSFALEEMFFPGEFESVEIIPFPERPAQEWKLEKLSMDSETLYDNALPWTVLLLTDADGFRRELGIGSDLWRMKGAGNTRWQITKCSDGIKVSAQIIDLTAEETVERRPWRFNYYLAWGRSSGNSLPPDKNAVVMQPELLQEVRSECFRAPAVRKYLRKLIRQQQDAAGDIILYVPDVKVCGEAGHLERPGKKELLHWDMDELFALYSWGNRQLGEARKLQIVLPEDSIFRKLPGGRYLDQTPGNSAVREITG